MKPDERTIVSSLTGTYSSRQEYERAVQRAFLRNGITPVKAAYDAAGNCLQCGECGRCPGWHLPPGKGE
jgi:hypothetical protein